MQLLTAVLTSWPFWTTVTIIAALLILRRDLRVLFGKARRFTAFGTTFEATEQRQAEVASPTPDSLLQTEAARVPAAGRSARDVADDILRRLPRSEYVTFREAQIEQALEAAGVAGDAGQKSRVLLAVAASSAMAADFNRLYSLIFGGQLKILQALNAGALPTDRLTPFYEAAATQHPEFFASYRFEQYLDFLTRQELILRQPDDDNIAITLKGRTFLVYCAHEGISLERAG
jgi:hypothetical protein